jgi:hypothetical protein
MKGAHSLKEIDAVLERDLERLDDGVALRSEEGAGSGRPHGSQPTAKHAPKTVPPAVSQPPIENLLTFNPELPRLA